MHVHINKVKTFDVQTKMVHWDLATKMNCETLFNRSWGYTFEFNYPVSETSSSSWFEFKFMSHKIFKRKKSFYISSFFPFPVVQPQNFDKSTIISLWYIKVVVDCVVQLIIRERRFISYMHAYWKITSASSHQLHELHD